MKELFEAVDYNEYNDEAGMVKNNLHTIVRVSSHLEKAIEDNENMPEWCQEKLAVAKGMIVAVMDYIISQHEQGDIPHTNEAATGGSTSTADVGANAALAPQTKQKKTKYGTAKNALDGNSIFARPARR
jgi:hypothetical protein